MSDDEKKQGHHLMSLFATERLEDYVVLALALIIIILVLVFF